MEGGDPGTYRQLIKDAANGEADAIDPATRRMLVAIANKADRDAARVDRIVTLLITTGISVGLLTASLVGNIVLGLFE